MTPETLRIDRRFKGVGRINRASGTTDPAVKRRIERMLTALAEDGRLDILRALRDGDVTFMQVYDAYRRKKLHELPIGDTMPLVSVALEKWIAQAASEYSVDHIGNLTTARRLFLAHAPNARVADLPAMLEKLRASYGVEHPRSFNLARSAAQAFVRSTLKKSHPLWLAVAAVEPRPVPKAAARPYLSIDDVRERFPHPQTSKVDAIAWSMAMTGMGQKELWGRWEIQSDRVRVFGTKRSGRVRDIPLVERPKVPKLSRDRFGRLFRERFNGVITPYDLRRTYMRWMEGAGIVRARRRLYMGHGAGDVSGLYERSEIERFLVEDAERLRAFLELNASARPAIKVMR